MNSLLLAVTLILQSGDRIAVEGPVRENDGSIIFRSSGLLYSVPSVEVLRIEDVEVSSEAKPKLRLRVSEEERRRLIAELEKNHGGTPPPPPPQIGKAPRAAESAPAPPPEDEHAWRIRARSHEENVRRAQEDLALLQSRIETLQDEISTLFTLGFKPRHFTYQTTQLARVKEQIPYAQLEVTRAERAWQQFREDARRAGVMPGWLR